MLYNYCSRYNVFYNCGKLQNLHTKNPGSLSFHHHQYLVRFAADVGKFVKTLKTYGKL